MSREPRPGPVVIPQTVQVKIVWANTLGQFTNVLHGNTGGTTAVNAQLAETLLTTFKNGMTTSGWAAIVHPSVALEKVTVKDLSAPYLPEFESSGAVQSGSGPTTPLGDHTALVVTHQTDRSGAQWRGRSYLPGLDASATADGNSVTSTARDAAGAFLEAIRAGMSTAQVPMVVAQRELLAGQDSHGNALPPRAANSVPVVRCIVRDSRLDTQRRRIH